MSKINQVIWLDEKTMAFYLLLKEQNGVGGAMNVFLSRILKQLIKHKEFTEVIMKEILHDYYEREL